MQHNNIFSDLSEKITKLKQNREKTTGHTVLDAIQKEESNDARSWLLIFIILAFLSAFTLYMAYRYYRFAFDPTFPGASPVMALGMAALTEIGKVMLAYTVFSSLIYGWMFRTWSKAFAGVFSLAIACGWYVWSYNVSTKGMDLYAADQTTISFKQEPLEDRIKRATADIDAQIAQLNASSTDASARMKTKRGNNNYNGQVLITTNATTLASLQEERSNLTKQVTEDYNKTGDKNETKANVLVDWVQRFGGNAEYLCALCILALIFFDKDSNNATINSTSARKVYEKVKANPGVKLTPTMIDVELQKAALMNGSYAAEPLGKP